jgi:hypothetical protein
MFYKTFMFLGLMVLGLMVFGLTGCQERIVLKSDILTQKVIDDCAKSDSKGCLSDAIQSRTDRYCSESGLSKLDCNSVKLEKLNEGLKIVRNDSEQTNKEIEVKEKQTDQLRRQNEEANRILGK